MIEKLRSAFSAYTDCATDRLFPRQTESKVKPIRNRQQLLSLVAGLEGLAEFRNLITATREHFGQERHSKSVEMWKHAVQNFFRRSCCYLELFEGRTVMSDSLFERYAEAFTKKETTVQYLAPLEFVRFSGADMEFRGFQIRSFKRGELASLLGSRANEVFYPWASVNLDLLRHYWFLCVSETVHNETVERKMGTMFHIPDFELVRTEHLSFPVPIESALKKLVLFGWQYGYRDKEKKDRLEEGWNGFGLPFVIRIDDNLLASPSSMPSLDGLVTQPKINQAGEEIGIEPVPFLYLDKNGREAFCNFVHHVGTLIEQLPQEEWKFVDIALNFIRKAFFSEEIDQLLWHIAAIDALVGEKEGGAKRLRQRLGAILADDSTGREKIDEQFKELYQFRNTLVHGDTFSKSVYVGHLRRARDFARCALIWFLNFLNHIKSSMPQVAPSDFKREDILNQIDLSDEKLTVLERSVRINRSLKQSFGKFPYVKDWVSS
jgi:hypothetical protein